MMSGMWDKCKCCSYWFDNRRETICHLCLITKLATDEQHFCLQVLEPIGEMWVTSDPAVLALAFLLPLDDQLPNKTFVDLISFLTKSARKPSSLALDLTRHCLQFLVTGASIFFSFYRCSQRTFLVQLDLFYKLIINFDKCTFGLGVVDKNISSESQSFTKFFIITPASITTPN